MLVRFARVARSLTDWYGQRRCGLRPYPIGLEWVDTYSTLTTTPNAVTSPIQQSSAGSKNRMASTPNQNRGLSTLSMRVTCG